MIVTIRLKCRQGVLRRLHKVHKPNHLQILEGAYVYVVRLISVVILENQTDPLYRQIRCRGHHIKRGKTYAKYNTGLKRVGLGISSSPDLSFVEKGFTESSFWMDVLPAYWREMQELLCRHS